MRDKKRVDLDGMGEGKDLVGVKSGGIIIRIYIYICGEKFVFN